MPDDVVDLKRAVSHSSPAPFKQTVNNKQVEPSKIIKVNIYLKVDIAQYQNGLIDHTQKIETEGERDATTYAVSFFFQLISSSKLSFKNKFLHFEFNQLNMDNYFSVTVALTMLVKLQY